MSWPLCYLVIFLVSLTSSIAGVVMSSSHPDGDLQANAVLRRFVRAYVETFATRRALRSCQLLEKAFENAQATPRRPASTVDMDKLLEKRHELVRRYSASAPVVAEPVIMRKSSIVLTQEDPSNVEYTLKASESSDDDSDDGEPQHEQQHVTFELVVQHLHSQLESLRDQNTTKDIRIAELETLITRLTTENHKLRHEIQSSKVSTTSTDTHTTNGNQSLTT